MKKNNLVTQIKKEIDSMYVDDFLKTLTDYEFGFNSGLDAVLVLLDKFDEDSDA